MNPVINVVAYWLEHHGTNNQCYVIMGADGRKLTLPKQIAQKFEDFYSSLIICNRTCLIRQQ